MGGLGPIINVVTRTIISTWLESKCIHPVPFTPCRASCCNPSFHHSQQMEAAAPQVTPPVPPAECGVPFRPRESPSKPSQAELLDKARKKEGFSPTPKVIRRQVSNPRHLPHLRHFRTFARFHICLYLLPFQLEQEGLHESVLVKIKTKPAHKACALLVMDPKQKFYRHFQDSVAGEPA